MIPAVAQTLAEILVIGSALPSTEQIDFNPPGRQTGIKPRISLYCYDIQESRRIQSSYQDCQGGLKQQEVQNSFVKKSYSQANLVWFDVSFLVSVYDYTALGEQHLLSEALRVFLCHQVLQENMLAPTLQGYGNLLVKVSSTQSAERVDLWNSLGVPLRPALYLKVSIPFNLNKNLSQCQEVTTVDSVTPVTRAENRVL